MKATIGGNKNGYWYIQGGPRLQSGYLSQPFMPGDEEGGPIPKKLQSRFGATATKPFSGLRIGQWKFLFETWITDQAGDTKPAALEVDTTLEPLDSLQEPSRLDDPQETPDLADTSRSDSEEEEFTDLNNLETVLLRLREVEKASGERAEAVPTRRATGSRCHQGFGRGQALC